MARVRHRHATVVLLGAMLTVLLLACARTAAGQQQEQQRWRRRGLSVSPAEEANSTAAATAADAARAAGDPRIVGGYSAGSTEFRFMAAYVERATARNRRNDFEQLRCGAALIGSPTSVWAITAAHCVEGVTASEYDVLVGSSRLDNSGTRHQVRKIFQHPNYKFDPGALTWGNDVALLQLKTAPARSIPRVELGRVPAANQQLTVVGWGTQYEGSKQRPVALQRVEVKVVARRTCNGPYSYNNRVAASSFCAGFMSGGKDACQGDSGGPILRAKPGGGWRSVGLVSWGEGCASSSYPGVYTNLASRAVASFINATAGIGIVS